MYYKVTGEGGIAFHGGRGAWPLPSGKRPGKFLKVDGKIVPCRSGLHFCREDQLLNWLGPVIWEFEPRGEILDAGDKLVCEQGRLLSRCDGWNERTARLFAVDCATRALNREKKAGRTPDKRSYEALKVARRFANGDASVDELAAAGAATWDAARAAAWDAAGAAERRWQTKRLMEYVTGARA